MWEDIDKTSDRLKVPGGWIVRSYLNVEGGGISGTTVAVAIHQVFVPDPEHKWELES